MSRLAPTRAAAIYVRRSHKDAEQSARTGRSLDEQEAECRALAAREGLEVVHVFAEREGTGASRRSLKARPQWEAALRELDTGAEFRTLIVWALDRADRRGATAVGELLDKHSRSPRRILGVDGTDTSDEKSRLATVIRAEVAREETERIAERVSRTKRHRRVEGRWLGGPPPFGLRIVDGRVDHDPETYPVARRIAEDLLNGETAFAITKRLNAEKARTPRGHIPGTRVTRYRSGEERDFVAEWKVNSLLAIVRSPAFAGLQSTRTRLPSGHWPATAEVFEVDGEPVSVGRGVITPGERARLLDVLATRTRDTGELRHADYRPGPERGHDSENLDDAGPLKVSRHRGKRAVSTLLGEVLRCAHCRGRVAVSGASNGHRSYRCAGNGLGGACQGFTAPVDTLDSYVAGRFVRRLAAEAPDSDLLAQVADRWLRRNKPDEVEARSVAIDAVEDARAAIVRVDDAFADGVMDGDAYRRQRERLTERLRVREGRLAALPAPTADLGGLMDPFLAIEALAATDVVEARSLLALAIDRVYVSRAGGRGKRFSGSERVQIVWAGEGGEALT